MTEMKTKTRARHETETRARHETETRARHVAEARHSVEMEGLSVDTETLADAQEYVDGRIGVDELVARAKVNCGLDQPR